MYVAFAVTAWYCDSFARFLLYERSKKESYVNGALA